MAIVLTSQGEASTTTDNTSPSTAAANQTGAVASGNQVLVFAVIAGNSNTAPTCSDNLGGAYALIGTCLYNSSGNILVCFARTTLLGSTTAPTVTIACGNNTGWAILVYTYSGVTALGSNAARQVATQANAAAGTPTTTFGSAPLTGDGIVCFIGNLTNPAGLTTPPTGVTLQWNVGFATPTTGMSLASAVSGITSATLTWGSSSATAFGAMAIELNGGTAGVLAITLADTTVSSTGSVPAHGALAITTDTVTVASAGTVKVQGALAVTLDSVTMTGGIHTIQGTLASTLDSVILNSAALRKLGYVFPDQADVDNAALGENDLSLS